MSGRLWFSHTGGMPIGHADDGSPIFADNDGVEVATELTQHIADVTFSDADPTEKENQHG